MSFDNKVSGESGWQPIETAPRDGEIILVNDTTGLTRWCAAKYLEGEEWQGWMYDDEISNDSNPCGPQPTHWIRLPEPPNVT